MVDQVGGTHYQTGDKPQHWDLAIMYQWDPFQYQITKYVMRWKDKHATPEKRLEDLKKARSFLDKYIENFEVYDRALGKPQPAPEHNNALFQCEGYYGDMTQLYTCRHCCTQVRATDLVDAHRKHVCMSPSAAWAEPTKGYVNQD